MVPAEVLEHAGDDASPATIDASNMARLIKSPRPKDASPEAETTPSDAGTTSRPPSAEPDLPAYPSDVRPPRPEDLAHYVADISGKGALYTVIHNNMGTINCELYEKRTPMTVANFVGLARGIKPFTDPKTKKKDRRRYYDGLTFHRVIPEFMIQGGDPLGTGRGGPGYTFANENQPDLLHDGGGVLAMAHRGRDTNGSQFYITEVALARLNGDYTVFGRCKEVEVVAKIARVSRDSDNRPRVPVTIDRVDFERKTAK
jgi:peptidyl-prolyl cis-trans isomerase A (cyclophilin A)